MSRIEDESIQLTRRAPRRLDAKAQDRRWSRRLAMVMLSLLTLLGTLLQPPARAVSAPADPADAAVSYLENADHNAVQPGDSALPPLTKAWSLSLPGQVSYPIIAAGRAFVTVTVPGNYGTEMYALDAVHGTVLWGPIDLGGFPTGVTNPTEANLAYDNGSVFVVNSVGTLTSYDAATGKLLWTDFPTSDSYATGFLQAFDGVLYLSQSSQIAAINESTGATEWVSSALQGELATLAVDSTGVYAVDCCGSAARLDLLTGDIDWSSSGEDTGSSQTPPVLAGGRLYDQESDLSTTGLVFDASTGASLGNYTGDSQPLIDGDLELLRSGSTLRAVDATTGAAQWSFTGDGDLTGSPLVVGDVAYEVSSAGILFAIDVTTGAEVWQGPVGTSAASGSLATSLAAGSGVLIVPSADGLTAFRSSSAPLVPPLTPVPPPAYVPPPATGSSDSPSYLVDPAHDDSLPGSELTPPFKSSWSTTVPGEDLSPAVVVGGQAFAASYDPDSQRNYLYGLDTSTGGNLWAPVDLGDDSTAGDAEITAGEGTLYAITGSNMLLTAVSQSTGRMLWQTQLPTHVDGEVSYGAGPPTESGGIVYVAADGVGGVEYAVDGASGALLWDIVTGGPGSVPTVSSAGVEVSTACSAVDNAANSGSVIWSYYTGCSGGADGDDAAYDNRLWFENSGWGGNTSLDLSDGTPVRSFIGEVGAAFAGSRGFFLAGSLLIAEDLRTGSIAWQIPLGADLKRENVLYANGVVYAATPTGVVGVDANTGSEVWSLTDPTVANASLLAGPNGLLAQANNTLTGLAPTIAPTVTGIVPRSGPSAGGTTVILTGNGFSGATDVFFGAVPATSFTALSSTEIAALSPPQASAVDDVFVTTPAGTSSAATGDQFTYLSPPAVTGSPPPSVGPPAPTTARPSGYDMVGSDGGVFVFSGSAAVGGFYGSLPSFGVGVNDIVGMVPSSDDKGYFLVGRDGGVFAFGDGRFQGSLPGAHSVVDDIAGIVPTSDNQGYFLVGRDGGVFAFGDATFLGSLPGEGVDVSDVTGIAATPDDRGYWVIEADGTVHAFGDAMALGSVSGSTSPVSAIAATPDGHGYWVVTEGGAVYGFGDARYLGSLADSGITPAQPVIGLVPTADQGGYWLIGSDGGIFAYGDAGFDGSLPADGVEVDDVVGAVPTR